jgi:sorbitol-specific phosphotransferase system component IIC
MKARWALVILGAWTMGSICMSIVATENFYTIDRLLEASTKPEFYAAVQKLGHSAARDLLRYLSSELNRLYFQIWNLAQIVLGIVALWLAGRVPRIRWGIAAMLAIVVLMLGYLTPQIVALGRSLDFVPRDPAPAGMQKFWVLHAAYTSLEMLKLVLGVAVTWWIATSKS